MAGSKKRIALKPHIEQIREWVEGGKTDEWIADALGTSASSVQSFRSRNDIYRRERGRGEPVSVFEGVLDHGERDGWGLWFDPAVAEDPIWREHWESVESVVVKLAEDSIVLEAAPATSPDAATGAATAQAPGVEAAAENGANGAGSATVVEAAVGGDAEGEASDEGPSEKERGRVKWFDPDKGYGFLVRPSGEDLFVHHSEVEGSPSDLSPGGEVEYVVGQNDRGPNARGVRLLG
jgi:cold shock CspA family protein